MPRLPQKISNQPPTNHCLIITEQTSGSYRSPRNY